MIALILGIISASSTKFNGTISAKNKSLHIASTIIFLVVTVLQVLQTIILARKDVSGILPCYYQKACQLNTIFLTRTKPVLRTRKRLHRSEIRELHPFDSLPVTARSWNIYNSDGNEQRQTKWRTFLVSSPRRSWGPRCHVAHYTGTCPSTRWSCILFFSLVEHSLFEYTYRLLSHIYIDIDYID